PGERAAPARRVAPGGVPAAARFARRHAHPDGPRTHDRIGAPGGELRPAAASIGRPVVGPRGRLRRPRGGRCGARGRLVSPNTGLTSRPGSLRADMTEVASVLYAREDIRRRVEELGRTITGEYVGRQPVLVSVLTGGAVFLADLVRSIDLPLETHFMAISRYAGAEESRGRVQILLDVDVDLSGRDVMLVEDIVDTGMTTRYLLSVLGARKPASLEICTLLDRAVRRIVPLEPPYGGFDCPDAFAVGY